MFTHKPKNNGKEEKAKMQNDVPENQLEFEFYKSKPSKKH